MSRLSDETVAYYAEGHAYPPPNPDEVALLAREVQRNREAARPSKSMSFPEPYNSKWDHPWGGDG